MRRPLLLATTLLVLFLSARFAYAQAVTGSGTIGFDPKVTAPPSTSNSFTRTPGGGIAAGSAALAGWRSYAFSDANNDYLIQGITAGWADTYDWYLPDQYIEVTGVENGYYILETTVDPDNSLRESDETNNCGSVLIRLSRMGTSSPKAELIRTGPPCHR